MTGIVYPDYMRVFERRSEGWFLKKGTLFYTRLPISIDIHDLKLQYGIDKREVVVELFRINGGKLGFYLADLRHKRYYYCGLKLEDVQATLWELGIGRPDPMDGQSEE